MQVLKILFQQRETRNVDSLGSELLMPLLRLLETDLAPQALEVLEELLAISAGRPAARDVLRMSMHFGSLPSLHSDPDYRSFLVFHRNQDGPLHKRTHSARRVAQI